MNVSTILKYKGNNVLTRSPEVPLSEIVEVLTEYKIGSVVIVKDGNRVCGIVSERDVVTAIAKNGGAVLDEPVSASMTRNVFSCTREDTLEKLMAEMTEHRFRHLPVVENGVLVGLVSIGDVVKQRMNEAELETASMRQYIATG